MARVFGVRFSRVHLPPPEVLSIRHSVQKANFPRAKFTGALYLYVPNLYDFRGERSLMQKVAREGDRQLRGGGAPIKTHIPLNLMRQDRVLFIGALPVVGKILLVLGQTGP